ncbi:hypothetical protein J6590_085260 [Homalodisca vitripennis]|nr:hypothetical protein J6590_085260 [Homalodisca vitripennis]
MDAGLATPIQKDMNPSELEIAVDSLLKSNMDTSMPNNKKVVLIDTDAGIDDAWAILMLLAAAKENRDINVIGITCVHGNATVDQISLNVLRTLESCKVEIPVYKGSSSPLIDLDENYKRSWRPFFGTDGFGCAEHDDAPDLKVIKEENAIVALDRIVNEHKEVQGGTKDTTEVRTDGLEHFRLVLSQPQIMCQIVQCDLTSEK